ncbi:MAG: O-methyltransferase [Clostridia bacterium]|nr:O-methyltransferase [Clostridia bacterium]
MENNENLIQQDRMEEGFKDFAVRRGVPIIRDSSHELLRELVKKHNPKHILEIGTAVGYSGITMLENCSADLVTVEKLEECATEAVHNFKEAGFENRVDVHLDDCSNFVTELLMDENNLEKFDFVFLDGPKAQYLNLLPSLQALLAPNGILVADNVLFRGYVENPKIAPKRFRTIWQRLRRFIEYVFTSGDFVDAELYRIEDGVLVARKPQKDDKK